MTVPLRPFVPFLKTAFIFAIFKDDGNLDGVIASLNIIKYPAKTSLLSLRIFTGISVFWIVFILFNLCNSLVIIFFLYYGKEELTTDCYIF